MSLILRGRLETLLTESSCRSFSTYLPTSFLPFILRPSSSRRRPLRHQLILFLFLSLSLSIVSINSLERYRAGMQISKFASDRLSNPDFVFFPLPRQKYDAPGLINLCNSSTLSLEKDADTYEREELDAIVTDTRQ